MSRNELNAGIGAYRASAVSGGLQFDARRYLALGLAERCRKGGGAKPQPANVPDRSEPTLDADRPLPSLDSPCWIHRILPPSAAWMSSAEAPAFRCVFATVRQIVQRMD